MAWQEEQRLRCPGCGAWLDETTQPEVEDAYEIEARRCHRCASISHAARAFSEGNGDTAGLHWLVHEPEDAEEVTDPDA